MEYFQKPAEETTTHKPKKPQSANSAAKEKPIGPAPVKAADSKQGDPQKPVLASSGPIQKPSTPAAALANYAAPIQKPSTPAAANKTKEKEI